MIARPYSRIISSQLSNKPQLHVGLIARSFPSTNCGIATYTGYLSHAISQYVSVQIMGIADTLSLVHLLQRLRHIIQKADIVHVQFAFDFGYMGWKAFPLYLFLRHQAIPVVTTLHELPDPQPSSLKQRIAQPYLLNCLQTIARNSYAIIVHTSVAKAQLAIWNICDNVHIIPHGTITTASEPAVVLNKTQLTVGFFGFIAEHKGVHHLINALTHLPDVRLIIAGMPRSAAEQSYYEELLTQIEELELSQRVVFTGFIPDEGIAAFFKQIDLAVFPYSQCTASGALHLALAHSCPALASNLPVFQELVDRYQCIETYNLSEPESLATHLQLLLSDPLRRLRLIKNCQLMIEATNWDQVAEQTVALYKTIALQSPDLHRKFAHLRSH